jgi:hypothetical protein
MMRRLWQGADLYVPKETATALPFGLLVGAFPWRLA